MCIYTHICMYTHLGVERVQREPEVVGRGLGDDGDEAAELLTSLLTSIVVSTIIY